MKSFQNSCKLNRKYFNLAAQYIYKENLVKTSRLSKRLEINRTLVMNWGTGIKSSKPGVAGNVRKVDKSAIKNNIFCAFQPVKMLIKMNLEFTLLKQFGHYEIVY